MMYKLDPMTLITGVPITIPEYDLAIHQPTLEEIGKIGEANFLNYMSIFFLDEGLISQLIDLEELPINIKEEISPYNSLLLILRIIQEESELQQNPLYILTRNAFKLILPDYDLKYVSEFDELMLLNSNQKPLLVEEELFNIIRDVCIQSLMLEILFSNRYKEESNASEAAKKIKEKMKKCEEKIRAMNKQQTEGASGYFSRLMSIVALQMGLENVKKMTVYQLHNMFERMDLYEKYKLSVRAALVGSEIEIVDWYKDIVL